MANQKPVNIREIWDLPRTQKDRMLAAILSAHVDRAGRFPNTPKRILQVILKDQQPHLHPWDHERLAVRIVKLLHAEGWIENRDTVSGRAGDWYLDLKRLGGRDDAIQRAQAAAEAAHLRQKYDADMIKLIIAALQNDRG